MRFTSFTAWSSDGLNRKVNAFLTNYPDIEIIDVKYAASFGAVYAAILYR
ncbi:MAG TPA: hypothetical protein VK030_07660 [Actinomycetales bacterium]|nr:hypothetical protein [Actinomycetales bacterium]